MLGLPGSHDNPLQKVARHFFSLIFMARANSLELHSRNLSDEEDDSEIPVTFEEELEESSPLLEETEGEGQRYDERMDFGE